MDRFNNFVLSVICLSFLSCASKELSLTPIVEKPESMQDAIWYRDFIKSNTDKVEVLAAFKQNIEQPVILIIHGHQSNEDNRPFMRRSMGGLWFSPKRLMDQVDKGYAIVSMSMPGYGASSGDLDFCGPKSKDAVHSVLNWIRKQTWANPQKIGLYGVSRGAILGALVAEEDPNLAAVALSSGSYDLEEDFQDPHLSGIKKNMEIEIKPAVNSITLKERSAILKAALIKIPILILHGTKDVKGKIGTAKKFANEIAKSNGSVFFKEFSERGHLLDKFEEQKEVHEFFYQYLKTQKPNFSVQ